MHFSKRIALRGINISLPSAEKIVVYYSALVSSTITQKKAAMWQPS